MSKLFHMSERKRLSLSAHRGWFIAWGLALIILGILAISYSTATTIISILFLGVILTIGGIIVIIDSFHFWWRTWGSFFLEFIMGILYFVVGIMLIKGPLASSISLTLLFSILFITVGVFRIIYSMFSQVPGRGWGFLNGLITLILGIMILSSWPMSGLFIIGLFIGIDLLVAGWVYLMAAIAIKKQP